MSVLFTLFLIHFYFNDAIFSYQLLEITDIFIITGAKKSLIGQ